MENQEILDLLLVVAPERKKDLEATWTKYEPVFVVGIDQPRFVFETNSWFIRYTHRTKLKTYLLGWVLWLEMYCWSTFIWELAAQRRPFILSELEAEKGQDAANAAADELYKQALAFIDAECIDWSLWPSKVPKPDQIPSASEEDWFIKDLVQQAIAFFLLHELRHFILAKDRITFTDSIAEEFECDRWATECLLDQSSEYARSSGQDCTLVRSKRAMGIALGKGVMAHVQSAGL